MLVRQLDGYTIDASFSTTFIPLEISLFSLTVTSFYQKGGNQCKFVDIIKYHYLTVSMSPLQVIINNLHKVPST